MFFAANMYTSFIVTVPARDVCRVKDVMPLWGHVNLRNVVVVVTAVQLPVPSFTVRVLDGAVTHTSTTKLSSAMTVDGVTTVDPPAARTNDVS